MPCMSQVTSLYCPNTVSQVWYKTGPTPISCLCFILCSTYLYLVLHCRSPTSDTCRCMCMTEVGTTILFLHDISVYWLYYLLAICVHIGNTIEMLVAVCTQLSYLCSYRSFSFQTVLSFHLILTVCRGVTSDVDCQGGWEKSVSGQLGWPNTNPCSCLMCCSCTDPFCRCWRKLCQHGSTQHICSFSVTMVVNSL